MKPFPVTTSLIPILSFPCFSLQGSNQPIWQPSPTATHLFYRRLTSLSYSSVPFPTLFATYNNPITAHQRYNTRAA